jgi:hypothetical protein
MAWRETPLNLAASACEIQSSGSLKLLDIVNLLCCYILGYSGSRLMMLHFVLIWNTT